MKLILTQKELEEIIRVRFNLREDDEIEFPQIYGKHEYSVKELVDKIKVMVEPLAKDRQIVNAIRTFRNIAFESGCKIPQGLVYAKHFVENYDINMYFVRVNGFFPLEPLRITA